MSRAMQIVLFSFSILFLLGSIAFADDPIDPFTYLEPTYTYESIVPNPYPAYGDITGADSFNDGEDFALIWDSGNVGFFHEGSTAPYKVLSTAGISGISEVPEGFAVTNFDAVYLS